MARTESAKLRVLIRLSHGEEIEVAHYDGYVRIEIHSHSAGERVRWLFTKDRATVAIHSNHGLPGGVTSGYVQSIGRLDRN